ncbi:MULTISPECIES: hypothetical protein [Thermomonosporaceae]|nr:MULTISPECIES: hypothetical protein [Thermomonosporaceae]MDL4775423.1 hypothetical protein [Actinomadura xylanilytica]
MRPASRTSWRYGTPPPAHAAAKDARHIETATRLTVIDEHRIPG